MSIFNLPAWPIEELTGYKPKTTFWMDFSIADKFVIAGTEPDAIEDTHRRSWPQMQNKTLGIEGLTEYIMVLNWKIHQHYSAGRMDIAQIYDKLWRETDQWAMENLKGDDLDYFIQTTD